MFTITKSDIQIIIFMAILSIIGIFILYIIDKISDKYINIVVERNKIFKKNRKQLEELNNIEKLNKKEK